MARAFNHNRVRKLKLVRKPQPKAKVARPPISMNFEHPAHSKPVTLARVKWLERPDP